MIGGTSTGGLIAIMLGVLEMTVDEAIESFVALMSTIFKRERRIPFSLISGKIQPRYDTKELENAIKQVIFKRGLPENVRMRNGQVPRCRTFVVALSGNARQTVHFTNYPKRGEPNDMYDKIKLWEAARATSAATTFFAPMKIDGSIFMDGGIGANCPLDSLWKEARLAFGPNALEPQICCVLSVGTGKPNLRAFGENLKDVGQSLLDMATETDRTAERFYENHEDLSNRDGYFRFNPPYLDEVGMDEGDKQAIIRDRTEAYGSDFRERLYIRRFQEVAGTEPKQQNRNPINLSSVSKPTRLFYSLNKTPDHIRPHMKSYWHRLTLPAFEIYAQIAYDCQNRSKYSKGRVDFLAFHETFNLINPSAKKVAEVWARLLKDKSDVPNSRHPVSFVMAILHMLHMERFDPDQQPTDLYNIEGDRREALKRFDRWVPCECKKKCGRQWNFANDIGFSKGGESRKCAVENYLRGNDFRNAFATKDRAMLEAMHEKWRRPRHHQ
ncbi:Hypothetical protein R9X50_00518900 [Acrodontium crateriforme]|uniref:PNPLA domain-containing protein n=1 Tax=Acrodontium crateriforme TaxID=150365 RepID=A0AAQ3RAP5_9PEZI|nr:Hypothetical protein R9X50_00518900 [Acrodontium crateriforme]